MVVGGLATRVALWLNRGLRGFWAIPSPLALLPYRGMAPKHGAKQQYLQLGQLVAGIVKEQSRAGQQPGTWACGYCVEGGTNWAHRQTCFKCHRDRNTGVLVTPVAAGSGSQQGKNTRPQPRAKSAAPALKATQPASSQKAPAGESQEDEEDPVAQELEDARAYHSWVRQQKARVRDKELPAAEERLAKAETADKQRKPPGERLQSALSRVAHRQTLATAATEAKEAAEEALQTAKKEAAQAHQKLAEAQQELAVAQQAHKVWGQDARAGPHGEPGSYLGAHLTPDQKSALEELSNKYLGTEVGTLLYRVFPMAGLQPDPPEPGPTRRSASDGAKRRGEGNTTPQREPTDRSRSRPRDGDKAADAKRRHLNKDPPADPEDKDKVMSPGDI